MIKDNSSKVRCDKCNMTSISIPGKKHRRCPSAPGSTDTIRSKDDKLPSKNRGTWSIRS